MKLPRLPAPMQQQLLTYGFPLALFLLFFYIVFNNLGLYPFVFADEWLYSQAARLQPLAESVLPSYLYLAVYRLTNICGSGFLECARLLNVLFYVASGPLLYVLAARVCSKPVAMLVAFLCLLGSASSFTIYFMPESMYFFGFCVLSWLTLTYQDTPPIKYGLLAGGWLGVMSVIKIHALFLLPGLLAFMLYVCWFYYRPTWLRRSAQMMLTAAVAMLAVKTVLSVALAGPAGLNFLGSFYGSHAQNHSSGHSLIGYVLPALHSLWGHTMAMALLMALPIAGLVLYAISGAVRAEAGRPLRSLQVYSVLMLGTAGALAVAFTASLTVANANEAVRLHMRYYDFVFPLLMIIGAAALSAPTAQPSLLRRLLVAVPLMGLVLYAFWALPRTYFSGYVDSPELHFLTYFPQAYRALVVLQVVTLGVWALHRTLGSRMYVFLLLPLVLLISEAGMRRFTHHLRAPTPYDKAGLLVNRYLDKADRIQLTVAGHDLGGVRRALFHIDTPGAELMELQEGAALASNELPVHRKWLLIVGKHALPGSVMTEIASPEFTLLRLSDRAVNMRNVHLSYFLPGSILASAEGMSDPESFGRWSEAKEVRLNFRDKLPRSLNVMLKGRAFGPNTQQTFSIVVGGQRQTFRLPEGLHERFFQFETDGLQSSISIEVPQPTTPKELGQGNDPRKLGIALYTFEIGSRDQ